MNFKFQNQYLNVTQFYPLNKCDLISVRNLGDDIYFNESIIEASLVQFERGYILGFNSKFQGKIISLVNGKIFDTTLKNSFRFYFKENLFIATKYNVEMTSTINYLINIETKQIIYDFNLMISSLDSENDKIYFKSYNVNFPDLNQKIISCFSFTKIDYLWNYNIDSLYESHPSQMAEYEGLNPEVNRIIGVQNGILWLDIIVRAANSFILGLDAATGTVVHFLQDISLQNKVEYHQLWPQFGLRLPSNNGNTFIDTDRNRLYGFRADDYYWQVDLNDASPTINVTSLKHLTQQYNCFFCDLTNCGISKQHIYFPVGGIGAKSNGVVVFNKDTMAIDYVLPLDPKQGFGAPNQVKINETHLFVKSKEGILSIFEKTED